MGEDELDVRQEYENYIAKILAELDALEDENERLKLEVKCLRSQVKK